jgi:hypothetical protein
MARWAPAAEEEVAGGRPDHTGERETEREGEERNREGPEGRQRRYCVESGEESWLADDVRQLPRMRRLPSACGRQGAG